MNNMSALGNCKHLTDKKLLTYVEIGTAYKNVLGS